MQSAILKAKKSYNYKMTNANTNSIYLQLVTIELQQLQSTISKKPSFWDQTKKKVQKRVYIIIRDKVHRAIAKVIKEITRAVILRSSFTIHSEKEVK